MEVAHKIDVEQEMAQNILKNCFTTGNTNLVKN